MDKLAKKTFFHEGLSNGTKAGFLAPESSTTYAFPKMSGRVRSLQYSGGPARTHEYHAPTSLLSPTSWWHLNRILFNCCHYTNQKFSRQGMITNLVHYNFKGLSPNILLENYNFYFFKNFFAFLSTKKWPKIINVSF